MEKSDKNNSSEYITYAIYKDKKEKNSTAPALSGNQKRWCITKVNEVDTVCAYKDYCQPKLQFSIWNINKVEMGWRNVEYKAQIATTLNCGYGWNEGSILFLACPNQGNAEAYICRYEPFDQDGLEVIKLQGLKNTENNIAEGCLLYDQYAKRLLIEEIGTTVYRAITSYNLEQRKSECYKIVDDSWEITTMSYDKNYMVGYTPTDLNEDHSDVEGHTVVNITRYTYKKILALYLLKYAQISVEGQKVTLLEYFGSPFLAQHVAEFLK